MLADYVNWHEKKGIWVWSKTMFYSGNHVFQSNCPARLDRPGRQWFYRIGLGLVLNRFAVCVIFFISLEFKILSLLIQRSIKYLIFQKATRACLSESQADLFSSKEVSKNERVYILSEDALASGVRKTAFA